MVIWGDNSSGQQLVPSGLSNVTAVAAAASDTLALLGDGTVVGWGNNVSGQLNIPADLSNVVGIAVGAYNGYALKSDGTLVQWGSEPVWQQNGTNIELKVAPGMSNIVRVASGDYSGWSLQNDGSVAAWGWNTGQRAFSCVALAAAGNSSDSDYGLMLMNGGTISTSGSTSPIYVPNGLSAFTNVIAISAGMGHAAVLVNDGTPTIVQPLRSQITTSAQSALFDAGVVGPSMNYQWQFSGINIGGATNAALVLSNVPLTVAGNYRCIASNAMGVVTSAVAVLSVIREPLRFDSSANTLRFTNGIMQLRLIGLAGAGSVVIYASGDLAVWDPIFGSSRKLGSGASREVGVLHHGGHRV